MMLNTKPHISINFATDLDFSEILTNPILDIAARFWEKDRYEAFQICYRSMRILDDLVDDLKSEGRTITSEEKTVIAKMITDWTYSLQQNNQSDQFMKQLQTVIHHYSIPIWPWERLAQAMLFDLEHDSFRTLLVFLRYCEGAAISPASIFMHLCAIRQNDNEITPGDVDIRKASRPLALFSYFVHIMRDFQKDQLAGLNYFAEDIMSQCQVTNADLAKSVKNGNYSQSVRKLLTIYRDIAEKYRSLARSNLDLILPQFPPRYQLSLEMIYSLYLQIFERVNPQQGMFDTETMNPTGDEVQMQIDKTLLTFKPF